MPKKHSKRTIIHACVLCFEGDLTRTEISELLDVTKPTLKRWEETDLWKEMEAKLIKTEIAKATESRV